MYRILFTRGTKAYAIECDVEFKLSSDWHDNLFDENLHEFVNNGDCIGFIDDIEDFERYFPDYELEIVERD